MNYTTCVRYSQHISILERKSHKRTYEPIPFWKLQIRVHTARLRGEILWCFQADISSISNVTAVESIRQYFNCSTIISWSINVFVILRTLAFFDVGLVMFFTSFVGIVDANHQTIRISIICKVNMDHILLVFYVNFYFYFEIQSTT